MPPALCMRERNCSQLKLLQHLGAAPSTPCTACSQHSSEQIQEPQHISHKPLLACRVRHCALLSHSVAISMGWVYLYQHGTRVHPSAALWRCTMVYLKVWSQCPSSAPSTELVLGCTALCSPWHSPAGMSHLCQVSQQTPLCSGLCHYLESTRRLRNWCKPEKFKCVLWLCYCEELR